MHSFIHFNCISTLFSIKALPVERHCVWYYHTTSVHFYYHNPGNKKNPINRYFLKPCTINKIYIKMLSKIKCSKLSCLVPSTISATCKFVQFLQFLCFLQKVQLSKKIEIHELANIFKSTAFPITVQFENPVCWEHLNIVNSAHIKWSQNHPYKFHYNFLHNH